MGSSIITSLLVDGLGVEELGVPFKEASMLDELCAGVNLPRMEKC